MKKKILLGLLAVLVIIQFIKPEKNISTTPSVNSIHNKFPANEETMQILKTACNDCHTNNTVYPWYANIQPVAWWLDSHVDDGKRHLNFDEFLTYKLKKQDHKLEELIESQEDHWMPLDSYTWIHQDAKLNETQRLALVNWAKETRLKIQSDPAFALEESKK
ncbi:heme-binding domain-containing protein [Pedobacter glucosidilyticus]|uniref:heme-binding domain-containing protein n=1 Tax=Pedobacter glucosidilyticus TaxID=1122941 RepID=UPI000424452D|nr:heme-binding domain-containing protein [Pedobacter glucosidilyticus]